MKVGIKHVAQVANVSPATVSRVLAGRSVDTAMRDRVLAAVEETGYRPNLAARRLRSQRTDTIGLILADIRNPFFTAVSRTIESIAASRGWRVILGNTDEDPEREAEYLRLMQEERVTGVILATARRSHGALEALETDYPLILIDRALAGAGHDCVVLDNAHMAELLVGHLHQQGHRHVAGLFLADSVTGEERRAGFERAAQNLGMKASATSLPHNSVEAGRIVAELLREGERPDALLATNGVMMLTALAAIKELGLDVPGDIALAGFDNNEWMEFVGGGLTVIEQPVEEIGRNAMTMLLDRIAHPDAAPRRTILSGKLVVRASSGHRR